ncbi:MAG: TaqI-like C-terminal specificity domain-containing protein, partial [Nitrososphaerota archaeon]
RLDKSEKIFGYKINFDFKLFFPKVFREKGGFDVVIANPPYSGILKDREKLTKQYKFYDKRKNSASFFIERGKKISKPLGIISFIVPKSLTFSEGWRGTRNFIFKENKLIDIVDVSEAFEEVLLEQVIITFRNETRRNFYTFKTGEGWLKAIKTIGVISSELPEKLQILPIYIDNLKLQIFEKITSHSLFLADISETFRGLPFQNRCSTNNAILILRGENIAKYSIYGSICKVNLLEDEYKNKKIIKLMRPKIVSQNIVAHVKSPRDRIIIMATYDKIGLLTLDTVMNTFLLDNRFSYEYVLSVLNSRLAEWFYYWFVYNRAVRTMHFDEIYMGKLPIRIPNPKNLNLIHSIESLVSEILSLTQSDDYVSNPQKQEKVKELEKQIDQLVYKLYDLTEDEIKIVEGFK